MMRTAEIEVEEGGIEQRHWPAKHQQLEGENKKEWRAVVKQARV